MKDRREIRGPFLELLAGYALIEITLWITPAMQRPLFWITAAWFSCWAVLSALRGEPLGLKWPPPKMTILTVLSTLAIAGVMVLIASNMGTLHGLFGTRAPFLHGSTYVLWALVQQYIQQSFFFICIEKLMPQGRGAAFVTAILVGLAHLPNPVLAPVTFAGGWILSELFRRYRTLYPLAFAHGMIGLALAVSVPDHIHLHMRVGLGYLRSVH